MVVLILSRVPQRLRGYVTLFLFEVSTGVYIGNINTRVRKELWKNIVSMMSNDGRACLCFPNRKSEQGFDILLHNYDREVVDIDGIKVLMSANSTRNIRGKKGWSKQRWRNRRY